MSTASTVPAGYHPTSRRGRYNQRWHQLDSIFSSWKAHLREIARFLMPRRIRFDKSDHNLGGRRNDSIMNPRPRRAHRVMSSGLHAGITSPARPWFKFIFDHPQLMKRQSVKVWLADLEEAVRTGMARSNTYTSLPQAYEDLGAWGTTCTLIEPDDKDVFRLDNQPMGSYRIALDEDKRPRTLYRQMELSVEQIVKKFGYKNCSMTIQNLWDNHQPDQTFSIIHVIEPNDDRDPGRQFHGWKYRSVWYEEQTGETDQDGEGKFLRQSGYRTFPAIIGRWSVMGDNAYGDSPAMEALPDIKQLNHMEKRKLEVFDKIVSPPVNAPASMLNKGVVSLLPGAVNATDDTNANAKVTPAIQVDARAGQALVEAITECQNRIDGIFFADLFLMLAASPMRPNVTAREIQERHEEKMLQLGPVLERLHDELLDPMMERILDIMDAKGLLPTPPKEVEGMIFRVEYISILAQAQKLLGTVAIERLAQFVVEMSQAKEDVLDKMDFDLAAEKYAEMLGTPPELIKGEEIVAQIRRERERKQQEEALAMQAAASKDATQSVKNLAGSPTGGDNALSALSQIARGMGSTMINDAEAA